MRDVRLTVIRSVAELESLDGRPDVIALDIPIGLTERGPRDCDTQARLRLGFPRCCSVFSAPVRGVLAAASYAEANAIGRAADGRGISRQAWAIVPKILETDMTLRRRARLRARVHEVHPEVCFHELAGRKPMSHSKRRREGHIERRTLLRSRLDTDIEALVSAGRALGSHADDVLDALAALITAQRITMGTAEVLGDQPGIDRHSLPMRITC